jgi:hypothetical protein
MIREDPVMLMLRALAGLALGPSMLAATLGAAAPEPLTAAMAPTVAAIARSEPRRAEVAVSFGLDGRIAGSALVRSTGSSANDAVARDAALQLASLEPAAAGGHTRVFRIALP